MKKIMFAMAAAAGLMAFGDGIESVNTVGYATKAYSANNTFTVGQFCPMDGQLASMTLADFTPDENFEAGTDYALFFDSNLLNPLYLTYFSQAIIDENKDPEDDENPFNTMTAGWYDMDDETYARNYNDTVVAYGTGFIVFSASGGSGITTAGEVLSEDYTAAFEAGNWFVGNPTPVNRTLGEVVGDEDFQAGSDYALFFDSNLLNPLYLTYFSQDVIDENKDPEDDENPFNTMTAGWYDMDDETYSTNYNDRAVNAGEGFIFFSASGSGLIWKKAL